MLALSGCSTINSTKAVENKADNTELTKNTELNTKKDVYVPNPQVTDDINLVKVGEAVRDAKGELTLKAYKNVNETIKVGRIEMIIKDVKVVHFVPDYSMIDFFHAYTHDEEFDFVKVAVEVKNPSDEVIKFSPIAALKMNNGEHKTWEDDIYLEELTGEIQANDTKKGNMGFILEDTNDIQWVELLTSDSVDNNHDIIEQGKQIKIDF
jgi:hypothetical protein